MNRRKWIRGVLAAIAALFGAKPTFTHWANRRPVMWKYPQLRCGLVFGPTEWSLDDGRWSLDFDGTDDYVEIRT